MYLNIVIIFSKYVVARVVTWDHFGTGVWPYMLKVTTYTWVFEIGTKLRIYTYKQIIEPINVKELCKSKLHNTNTSDFDAKRPKLLPLNSHIRKFTKTGNHSYTKLLEWYHE